MEREREETEHTFVLKLVYFNIHFGDGLCECVYVRGCVCA